MAAALIWLIRWLATCSGLVEGERKLTKSLFELGPSYRGSLRVPLKRKARAVLPSVEAVCTGCWLVKIVEPAIMPTRNAPAKISIIGPTGCGEGWNRLICRSKSSRSRWFICTSTQPLCPVNSPAVDLFRRSEAVSAERRKHSSDSRSCYYGNASKLCDAARPQVKMT
jgi:hypothetical protein